jgi:hypothetical protein
MEDENTGFMIIWMVATMYPVHFAAVWLITFCAGVALGKRL